MTLVPVVLMAPVAAGSYWLWWTLELPYGVMNTLFWSVIAVQTVIASVFLILAWRSPRRPADPSPVRSGLAGQPA